MEEGINELGEPQLPIKGKHIKKKALKNKALAISFNEKELNDFVTGFHKRKKKRRKEAERKQEEAKRRKRLEARKKRRLEREFALYGGAPPETDAASNEGDEFDEDDKQEDPVASVSGTATYDSGEMQITVTTSEISHEKDIPPSEKPPAMIPKLNGADRKHNIPVTKKKSFKKASKSSLKRKPRNKKDKKKGKKKKNARR